MSYTIKLSTLDRKNKKVELLHDSTVVYSLEGDLDIISSIQELLKKENISLREVARVAFDNRPGSFTGLKIGAVISNVLNWCLGKITISEVELPEYGSDPNIQKSAKME